MDIPEKNIAVIYIVWLPFGFDPFRSFIESYLKHSAGTTHKLIIVFKDVLIDEAVCESYHLFLQQYHIAYQAFYHHQGLDIDTYYYAAAQLTTEYCMFFNSKSILLADDWLYKMSVGMKEKKVGVIAATGSYESHYSSVFINHPLKWETDKSTYENYRKYKLFIKAFFLWQLYFKKSPNPHVRTNAFIINRKLFLSLKHKLVRNKFDAYLFESGRNSMTNQLLKKGLQPLLINKTGHLFGINDWYNSAVFRSHYQEGLMVSDNQTRLYEKATEGERKKNELFKLGEI